MWPYFILLFLAYFLSIFIDRLRQKKHRVLSLIILLGLLLVLFAGMRNASVGTDTGGYASSFTGRIINRQYQIDLNISTEKGFIFLQYLSALFSTKYYILLFFIALISVYFQLKAIYEISDLPAISVFVLISFNIYLYMFNGARQGIALSIYLYALKFIIEKKFWKYVFWIFIAYLFHRTVLFLLPFYLILKIKFSFKLVLILTLSTIILVFMFSNILQLSTLLSDKYNIYSELEAKGGQLLTIAYVLLSLIFIILRYLIHKACRRKYDIFLNSFIIGALIFLVVQLTGAYIEITRMAIYFLASAVFLWATVFKCSKKENKAFIYIFFIIFHLMYYYLLLLRIGNLTPYLINKELFNF